MTFNNLGEMDKFIAKHRLPKLTQGDIENLKTPAVIIIIFFKERNLYVCVFSRSFYCSLYFLILSYFSL